MEEYISSFLISLAAGLVTPWFQKQPDKTVEESLDRYFLDALWDWTTAKDGRKTHYPIESYQDLLKYLGEDGTLREPELEELIILWQNKLMDDPATAAFLTNFKLDKLNGKVDTANVKLDYIDANVLLVGCQLQTVGSELENMDGKIDNIAGLYRNIDGKISSVGTKLDGASEKMATIIKEINKVPLASNPNTTELSHREKKDLETLTNLMKAFSFDLIFEFCRDYPDYVRVDVVNCYDAWNDFIERPTFKIFNSDLSKVIMDFYTSWKEVIDFGELYFSPSGIPDRYTFHGLRGDMFINDDVERAYREMTAMRIHLYPRLKAMADYILDNYDLDLDALAMQFFRR